MSISIKLTEKAQWPLECHQSQWGIIEQYYGRYSHLEEGGAVLFQAWEDICPVQHSSLNPYVLTPQTSSTVKVMSVPNEQPAISLAHFIPVWITARRKLITWDRRRCWDKEEFVHQPLPIHNVHRESGGQVEGAESWHSARGHFRPVKLHLIMKLPVSLCSMNIMLLLFYNRQYSQRCVVL